MESGTFGRRKLRVNPRRNQSDVLFALIILEFVYERDLAGESPPTAHFIQMHAKKLRTSQFSRVQETLAFIEQSGWVEHSESTAGTSYTVTTRGKEFWAKVGKQALEAFTPLYAKGSVSYDRDH